MSDGNFLRIVVVPTIRMMTTKVGSENYAEFYLPLLTNGTSPWLSQSVTLICQNVNQYMQSSVTQVTGHRKLSLRLQKVLTQPFSHSQPRLLPKMCQLDSTVQLYIGEVSVSMGLYA